MKKEELIKKIKNCIDENISAQLAYREKKIKETFANLTVSNGTLDTCLQIKSLMDDENTLRRTYDNRIQWILALETITERLELLLDKCLYDLDYEMITAYNIRIVINDAIGLHIEHEKSASREFEEKYLVNCRIRWGIAYLERKPEPSKFTSCNVANPAMLETIMVAVEKASRPHRYQ